MADAVREAAGVPMHCTSGPRCWSYNSLIGGAKFSEHVDGDAMDVACDTSRKRALIVQAAIRYGVNRIGIAKGFIHLGVSEKHDQNVMWVYD